MIKTQPNKNVLIFSHMRSGTTACVQSILRDNSTMIDFSYGLQVQKKENNYKVVQLNNEGVPTPKFIKNSKWDSPSCFFNIAFSNILKHNSTHNNFYVSKVMVDPEVAFNVLESKNISDNFEKIVLWRNPIDVYLSFLAAKENNNFYGDVFDVSGTIDVSTHIDDLLRIIGDINRLTVMYLTNKDKFKLVHYKPDGFGPVDAVHQRSRKYNETVFINDNCLTKYLPLILTP